MEKELLRTGEDHNLLVFNARLQEKVHEGNVVDDGRLRVSGQCGLLPRVSSCFPTQIHKFVKETMKKSGRRYKRPTRLASIEK